MITEARMSKSFYGKTRVLNSRNISGLEIESYQKKINSDWSIINGHYLERTFQTKNFTASLVLTNKIGVLAQEYHFQPDITLSCQSVKVTFCTEEIMGLSEKDFSLAHMIDIVYF